jgi:hypothetical protein
MGGVPTNYLGEVVIKKGGNPDYVVPGLMAAGTILVTIFIVLYNLVLYEILIFSQEKQLVLQFMEQIDLVQTLCLTL